MEPIAIFLSQALAPFVLLAMLSLAIPVTWAIKRWMPDCRLKRILLWSYGKRRART